MRRGNPASFLLNMKDINGKELKEGDLVIPIEPDESSPFHGWTQPVKEHIEGRIYQIQSIDYSKISYQIRLNSVDYTFDKSELMKI